jgi:hypothetical protein
VLDRYPMEKVINDEGTVGIDYSGSLPICKFRVCPNIQMDLASIEVGDRGQLAYHQFP